MYYLLYVIIHKSCMYPMAGIIQLFFTALFNVNIRNKQRNMTTSSMPVKDTIFMAVRDCEQVYTRFIHSFIHSWRTILLFRKSGWQSHCTRWLTHCAKWVAGTVIYGVKWMASKR